MISEARRHGGSVELSSAVDLAIGYGYLIWIITMSASGKSVQLPSARNFLSTGPHVLYVVNAGATFTFDVITNTVGTKVVSNLPVGQWARLSLMDNSTASGSWRARVSATLA